MPEAAPRPSIVLHGFTGGIAGSADIALRVAQVVLEGLLGQRELSAYLPLQAQDRADTWSISCAVGGDAGICNIDIRKLDGAVLATGVARQEQLLPNATIVEKLAAILAESAGGAAEPGRQEPFAVTDNGDTWLVRGSYNLDRSVEGKGPLHLEIRKRDAAVLDMCFEGVMHLPPEVKALLREAK